MPPLRWAGSALPSSVMPTSSNAPARFGYGTETRKFAPPSPYRPLETLIGTVATPGVALVAVAVRFTVADLPGAMTTLPLDGVTVIPFGGTACQRTGSGTAAELVRVSAVLAPLMIGDCARALVIVGLMVVSAVALAPSVATARR